MCAHQLAAIVQLGLAVKRESRQSYIDMAIVAKALQSLAHPVAGRKDFVKTGGDSRLPRPVARSVRLP